jgi:hypothetical protein
MTLTEFEAGLENIRRAITAALEDFGVTLLPGEISHHPLDPKRLPDEVRLSLAPKGAAFVTGTFTRAEIEASIRGIASAELQDKVRGLTEKYAKAQQGKGPA